MEKNENSNTDRDFRFRNKVSQNNSRTSSGDFWDQTNLDGIFMQEEKQTGSDCEGYFSGNKRRRNKNCNPEIARNSNYSCNNRICWWEPVQQNLPFDFCQNTSLHGLKFIGQPKRHLSERIFWIISFIVGVCMAALLIANVYSNFTRNPIIVSFVPIETRIKDIPFPAITICNMNKVRKTKANEYMRIARGDENDPDVKEALKDLYYLNHVCSTSNSFSKKFNYSISRGKVDEYLLDKISDLQEQEDFGDRKQIKEFFTKGSQTCADMVPFCIWRDRIRNCSQIIRPVETDFGKCCTFNMVPQTLIHRYLNDSRDDPKIVKDWEESKLEMDDLLLEINDEYGEQIIKKGSKYPRRVRRAGKSFGLSIFLEPDINEYFCTTSDSTGFRLETHLPIDVPHVVDTGIGIPPNSEVFVSMIPDVTSVREDDIRSFPLKTRLCYLKGEYSLKFYKFYTVSNCIDECISNRTNDACECVRYFMPRDDERELCDPESFNCTDSVRREFITTPVKEYCSQCYPTCTEISYKGITTVTTLQNPEDIWGAGSDYLLKHKNASIVHIYFAEDSFYPKVRKQLYDSTDLIANTGGLLGLCLGFSGLSGVELIYFLTLQVWCKFRRNRLFGKIEDKFENSSKISIKLKKRREEANGTVREVFNNDSN